MTKYQIVKLSEKYSYGAIAEMAGLTRSQIAGIIFRARHGNKSRVRFGGRKTGLEVKHKTRFTRWHKPADGMFFQSTGT